MSMYSVDKLDEVATIEDIPRPVAGAPEPMILATEYRLLIAYSVPGLELGQIGPTGRMVIPDDLPPGYEPVAVVEFEGPIAHFLGPPNDEAFKGHPLAARGLRPYGTYEIKGSSWVRALEKMNRVHPRHSQTPYRRLRHFVISFHDSTFECIARAAHGKLYETEHPKFIDDLREALQAQSALG